MTLYEEYVNGLNPIVYYQKAYYNLFRAVIITLLEEGYYDERDAEVLWDLITNYGNIEILTEKFGVRQLIRDSFNVVSNFIDSRQLAVIRDYEKMSISDFLVINGRKLKEISRDETRVVKVDSQDEDCFLDCATSVGLRKFKNEDFACAVTSPLNDKIKLLMVCDGVGGSYNGDLASYVVVREFINWFGNFNFDNGNIEAELQGVINRCKEVIKDECVMAATTLTFAIVLPDETIIGNVGDSRAYIIKDNELVQVSKDDSEIWERFYDCDNFSCLKDQFRFMPGNNVITKAIDLYYNSSELQVYHISNLLYDGILLTSDGVTDVLSDKSIARIINDSEMDFILDKLLYESCFGEPDYPSLVFDDILYPTLPGKDNVSASMYLKLTK